eukprot:296805-Karenia_brevis.AAC.1
MNISAISLMQSAPCKNSFRAMAAYKNIIRAAASTARNAILQQDELPASQDCILTSCSRAVFAQDKGLAQNLLRQHRIAREHIRISGER